MPKWTKSVVPGTHHVQVDLDYEGGRRTSWNADIVIAGDAQSRLENALRDVTPVKKPGGINWLIVLAVVIVLAFVAGAIILRRRSRKPARRRPPVNYRAV